MMRGEALGEWCLRAERRGGEEGIGEVAREVGWERDCSVGTRVRLEERERSIKGRVVVILSFGLAKRKSGETEKAGFHF